MRGEAMPAAICRHASRARGTPGTAATASRHQATGCSTWKLRYCGLPWPCVSQLPGTLICGGEGRPRAVGGSHPPTRGARAAPPPERPRLRAGLLTEHQPAASLSSNCGSLKSSGTSSGRSYSRKRQASPARLSRRGLGVGLPQARGASRR